MYTRCHPITSIFQKTILLKDSKYNVIMHRQLHSESLVIFSKIENKLKPLHRCFSRAPKNNNSNSKARNIEGIGLTNKSLPNKTFVIPKFPREMLQQQFDPKKNQETLPRLVQNDTGPDTLDKFPMSMNNSIENGKGSGTITIVIDKSDICNCKLLNEDVTIHVTTVPKISSKRLIESLSQAELANVCSAKCSCCQQCEESRKLANTRPNSMFPTANNGTNVLNSLPRRQQNLSFIPLRSISMINEGFQSPEIHRQQIKKSRSMENFRGMRKMVVPSNVDRRQSNFGLQKLNEQRQQKQSQRDPSVHRERSQSRFIPSTKVNSKQKQLDLSRTMEKNMVVKSVKQSQPMRQRQPLPLIHRGGSASGVILSGKQKLLGFEPMQKSHGERSESRMNVSRNIGIRQKQLATPLAMQPKRSVHKERSRSRPNSSVNQTNHQRQIESSQQNLSVQKERLRNGAIRPSSFTKNQRQLPTAQAEDAVRHKQSVQSQQRGRSQNRTLPSGNLSNHQQLPVPQTFKPNLSIKQMEISQNRRNLSVNNQKQVIIPQRMNSNLQQNQRNSSINKHTSQEQQLPSRMLQASGNIARQDDKSRSLIDSVRQRQQNSAPQNLVPNKYFLRSNFIMEKSMEQINQEMIGRDVSKSQNLINRVLRPSSFALKNGHLFSNNKRFVENLDNMRAIQPQNLASVGTQKHRFFKLHPRHINPSPSVLQFGRKMSLINQLPILSKNKFSENRSGLPKMLNFTNENSSKSAFRQIIPNFSKKLSQKNSLLMAPHRTTTRRNVFSKNNFVLNRPPQVPLKNRNISNAPSPSFRSSPHRQSPRMVLTKRSVLRPVLNTKSETKNRHQNVSLNRNFTNQQRQRFDSKERSPTISPPRSPLITRSRSGNQLLVQKQPPKFVLRQRKALRPTYNLHAMKNFQEKNARPVRNFVRQQTPSLGSKQKVPMLPQRRLGHFSIRAPTTMSLSQRNVLAQKYFPRQQLQAAFGLRNTRPAHYRPGNSSFPLSKNFSGPKIFLQEKLVPKPSSPTIMRRMPSLASSNPRLSLQKFVDSPQRKITTQDQKQKRNEIRRMNKEKLQSSLPVSVNNQPSEIIKYVEPPKSLQSVIRPNANPNLRNPSGNNLQMEKMPQIFTKVYPRDNNSRTYNKDLQATLDNVNSNTNNVCDANPAVLFYAPGKLKLISTPMPRLSDEKGVIVKMLYVHLTDADAQMLSSVQDGPYKLTKPTLAGKCGSGVIVDVGKEVQNVKIGDNVSIKPVSCGKCSACQNNNALMCKRVPISQKFGILKRFHALPAKFVTKLPNKVHPIDGAMMSDLSSAIRACKKSFVTAGDNVLVLDAGSLGLWTALAAKSMGATNVCLADTRASELEQAKNLGIDRLFLINPNSSISNTSANISEYMEGDNPRIVFDCSGSTLTNQIAIKTAKMGGKVVLMKNFGSNQPIVLSDAIHRGVDILSSQHGNDNSDRAALQFLASGKVRLNGIDSRFFDISNVNEAFRLLASGTNSNIFVQLNRIDEENNAKEKHGTS